MDYVIVFTLALALGLVGGVGVCWLFNRTRLDTVSERIKAQTAASQAAIQERLNGREQTIGELQGKLSQTETLNAQLNTQLQAEILKRSSAETTNNRIPQLEELLQTKEKEMAALRTQVVDLWSEQNRLKEALKNEQAATEQKVALVEGAKAELSNTFKAISADILRDNSQSFLRLAQTTVETYQQSARTNLELGQQSIAGLLEPIKESLGRFNAQVQSLEQTRAVAYQGMSGQIQQMLQAHEVLRHETNNLVTALRQPQVRGRWGEIQLRRVVEIAGMVEQCDFVEQYSVALEEEEGRGTRIRPDMMVKLPGGKCVIVDSKAPLSAYLDALEAPDDTTRQNRLKQHAQQVRTHLTSLGKKNYSEYVQSTPEFVVLFLPGEAFFSAALEQDPTLIETGVEMGVILATPTTLIALLRTVAHSWKQESIAQNASEISKLGRELYKSVGNMTGHWLELGKSLKKTTEAYNDAVGSLERNVLSKARRFKELKAADDKVELEGPQTIGVQVRPIVADELQLLLPNAESTVGDKEPPLTKPISFLEVPSPHSPSLVVVSATSEKEVPRGELEALG